MEPVRGLSQQFPPKISQDLPQELHGCCLSYNQTSFLQPLVYLGIVLQHPETAPAAVPWGKQRAEGRGLPAAPRDDRSSGAGTLGTRRFSPPRPSAAPPVPGSPGCSWRQSRLPWSSGSDWLSREPISAQLGEHRSSCGRFLLAAADRRAAHGGRGEIVVLQKGAAVFPLPSPRLGCWLPSSLRPAGFPCPAPSAGSRLWLPITNVVWWDCPAHEWLTALGCSFPSLPSAVTLFSKRSDLVWL